MLTNHCLYPAEITHVATMDFSVLHFHHFAKKKLEKQYFVTNY